jgi:hypothetical protein
MVLVHFFENKTIVLSQLLANIPAVNENIKIKGKKGKVLSVNRIDESLIHVHIVFEKVTKNQPAIKEVKKKR